LDGPLRRDLITGTYSVTISGANGTASGLDTTFISGILGSANQFTLCQFTPSAPLLPNTEYTAVLVGNNTSGFFFGTDRRFEGLTGYTSPSGFKQTSSGINTGVTSGFIQVAHPYNSTTQTNQYDAATGKNDVYTITIVSGHNTVARQGMAVSGFKYKWSQASTPGEFDVTVSGTNDRHVLPNGLQIDFKGTFASGEIHTLATYIPQLLTSSFIWKFSTGAVTSFATPPAEPDNISVVVDETDEGGFGVSTAAIVSGSEFYVINSEPAHLEYDVSTGTAFVRLQFNKPLLSGVYPITNVQVQSTPLLGLPTPVAASDISPLRLETSGAFLKIYLPV